MVVLVTDPVQVLVTVVKPGVGTWTITVSVPPEEAGIVEVVVNDPVQGVVMVVAGVA